jgi:predicted nucleic acid-binding protein
MILLDASTIIDGLRAKDLALLSRMQSVGGAVCGITRAEILSGARGFNDRTALCTILDGFQQIAVPESLWDEVGNMLSELRRKGVTVPLADAVLGTVAMSLNLEIWARNSDFNHMQGVLPALKLYQENP